MKKIAVLLGLVFASASIAAADTVPAQARSLASTTFAQIKELEHYALEGDGLRDADAMTYYRKFVNPLQATIDKYPSVTDPANRSWGDAVFCKDAAQALMLLGMGQNAKTNNESKALPWFQRQRKNCEGFVKSLARK